MAARLQRARRKGQPGMPPGAVYVGRGTRWGNPNRVIRSRSGIWLVTHPLGSPIGDFPTAEAARRFATAAYRPHLRSHPKLVAAARTELAGRDLACWCPLPDSDEPDHCHGAVLLGVAAGGPVLRPAATTLHPQGERP